MRRLYQLSGLVLLLGAAYVAHLSTQLPYYTSLGPGPGFFPLWLSLLLGVLAAAMAVQATLGLPEPLPAGFFAGPLAYARIAGIVIGLVAVAALIDDLGFIVTMLAFYLVLLPLLGRRRPIETAALSVVGSFGMFYLFSHLLNRPLPWGVLGF